MISSEVQRTLVKSPPELWTELSDPAALARHLEALGDVRITRAEPERVVEWEADGASGVVTIKPSGWGTRVILSATTALDVATAALDVATAAQADAPEAAGADVDAANFEVSRALEIGDADEPTGVAAPAAATSDDGAAPEALAVSEASPAREPSIAIEPATTGEASAVAEPAAEPPAEDAPAGTPVELPAPMARRGFFARLFGRRAKPAPIAVPDPPNADAAAVAPEGQRPETVTTPSTAAGLAAAGVREPVEAPSAIEALQARFAPLESHDPAPAPPLVAPPSQAPAPAEPAGAAEPEPELADASDLAAELRQAEEVAVGEVTAVLTAVLDRLGAAHHRPFSRA